MLNSKSVTVYLHRCNQSNAAKLKGPSTLSCWLFPREANAGRADDVRCRWTGCLCSCAPAEGRRTCSGAA